MSFRFDPAYIARFFDAYGEREWSRHDADAAARSSFRRHVRLLERFVEPGARVLEIGAGPGRFTPELSRVGARVVVADISPAQLEANRARNQGLPGVESFDVADICAMDGFADASFDAAVAFGGPLSYALERRGEALDELLRVVRPGGVVLASVMSLAGAFRVFVSAVLGISRDGGHTSLRRLWETGDQVTRDVEPGGHFMHMFRWPELQAMLAERGCEVLAASATNYLTAQGEPSLDALHETEPALWEQLLDLEDEIAQDPGVIGSGTHILIAARRP